MSLLSSTLIDAKFGAETAPERLPIGTFGLTGEGVAYILELFVDGLNGTFGLSFNLGGLGVMTGLAPGKPFKQDVEAYRADFWIPAVSAGISGCDLISFRKSVVSGVWRDEGVL